MKRKKKTKTNKRKRKKQYNFAAMDIATRKFLGLPLDPEINPIRKSP